jgi:hypothetical protein
VWIIYHPEILKYQLSKGNTRNPYLDLLSDLLIYLIFGYCLIHNSKSFHIHLLHWDIIEILRNREMLINHSQWVDLEIKTLSRLGFSCT